MLYAFLLRLITLEYFPYFYSMHIVCYIHNQYTILFKGFQPYSQFYREQCFEGVSLQHFCNLTILSCIIMYFVTSVSI